MLRSLARLLQRIGMVLLPVAVVLQLPRLISVGQMLTIALVGAVLFYVGHWIERRETR